MYWLGRDHAELDPRFLDLLDVGRRGEQGRVVDDLRASAEGQDDVVLHRRRGRDEVQVELALEALLDDLHVEQAEEAAAEPEAEGDRALGLVGEARVVEMELLEGVAEERVVLAADGVDAGEHEALGLLVARQRRLGGPGGIGERVADLGVADVLEPRGDVADLAGHQPLDGHELGPEHADLEQLGLDPAGHEPDRAVVLEGPLRPAGRRR